MTSKLTKAARLHNHKTHWIAGRLMIEEHWCSDSNNFGTLIDITEWTMRDMKMWLGY